MFGVPFAFWGSILGPFGCLGGLLGALRPFGGLLGAFWGATWWCELNFEASQPPLEISRVPDFWPPGA